ncbi:hypothetical protein D1007_12857 [Hordeum vulgare]|nr:hypothetical protein D1007_12857 [Hordeum vulgare]
MRPRGGGVTLHQSGGPVCGAAFIICEWLPPSSVGCGQLCCAVLLLEGSSGMSRRRPRKAVLVVCVGCYRAVDVRAAAPRVSLLRPDFYCNDDGGSEVGDAAMVAVVGSSPTCP